MQRYNKKTGLAIGDPVCCKESARSLQSICKKSHLLEIPAEISGLVVGDVISFLQVFEYLGRFFSSKVEVSVFHIGK